MKVDQKVVRQQQGRDYATVCIAIFLIVVSFLNIYTFAQKSQPGNAVLAGMSLLAGALLLATKLASMRGRTS